MKSGIGRELRDDELFGPGMREAPYPVYASLREREPVHWHEALEAWVLTRYDDVATALNDPRFSSRRVAHARPRFPEARWDPLFDALSRKMSEQDEPAHKRQRALVHDAFIRTAVEQWEPRIRARVEGLLDGATADGASMFDFIAAVAVPLPLLVIIELVGIPEEDRSRVKAWCDDFAFVALNYFAGLSEARLQRGLDSTIEFREYLRGLADERRRAPRRDLLSSLVHAVYEGSQLDLDELLANLLLLLSAGNETTTCLLGNSVAALLRHPDQWRRLCDEPARIPDAVEETLRFDGPVQFLGRLAADDVKLHGTTIAQGDLVLPVVTSANHDPAKFDRPEEFDITRRHAPHLSFGHGAHFCAGSQLARLEARVTLAALAERFPRLTLDSATPLVHTDNFNVRCFRELPVRTT